MLFLAVFPLNLALAGMAQFAPIRYHSNQSGRLGLIWSSDKFARLFIFLPSFCLLIKQPLRISPLRFIPSVRAVLFRPLDEISPVPSSTVTTSHAKRPYTGEFLTAVSGSTPLLLPSPCVDRFGSLLFPFRGQHVGAASFTLCYGLLLCFPFSGSYNASTQSVTQLHRLPARWAWLSDLYQNWTRFATSEQTMIYQDAPTLCWAVFYI